MTVKSDHISLAISCYFEQKSESTTRLSSKWS